MWVRAWRGAQPTPLGALDWARGGLVLDWDAIENAFQNQFHLHLLSAVIGGGGVRPRVRAGRDPRAGGAGPLPRTSRARSPGGTARRAAARAGHAGHDPPPRVRGREPARPRPRLFGNGDWGLRRADAERPRERARGRRPAATRALRRPQLQRAPALLLGAGGRARRRLGRRPGRIRGRAGVPRRALRPAPQPARRPHHHAGRDHQRLSRAPHLQRRRPPGGRIARHPVDLARAGDSESSASSPPASPTSSTWSTASTRTAFRPRPASRAGTRRPSSPPPATSAASCASPTSRCWRPSSAFPPTRPPPATACGRPSATSRSACSRSTGGRDTGA